MAKLLVIDDQPFLARAVCRLMRSKGWETLVACDPEEARDLYEDADIVLSDWVMPNGGGERVKRECPKPVVFWSGTHCESKGIISKLTDPDDLNELLRHTLHSEYHDHPSHPDRAGLP
ncbi:MAG: response regulator, partial [Gammaproteobacteria bacterium]|nr:response regulator [Gammaproteobacteria bacterium]